MPWGLIISKEKLKNMQQNNKCRLYGDRWNNHIISKLAQKEYKVIYRELCKWLKLDHTDRWYMHNPESVLEYEMHKIFWYFEMQTDHQIPTRKPDIILINKKKKRTYHVVHFAIPVDHRVKIKESDLARELKKLWNMKVTVIPIVVSALGMVPKVLKRDLSNWRSEGESK